MRQLCRAGKPGSLTTKQRVKSQHALALRFRFGGAGRVGDMNNGCTTEGLPSGDPRPPVQPHL